MLTAGTNQRMGGPEENKRKVSSNEFDEDEFVSGAMGKKQQRFCCCHKTCLSKFSMLASRTHVQLLSFLVYFDPADARNRSFCDFLWDATSIKTAQTVNFAHTVFPLSPSHCAKIQNYFYWTYFNRFIRIAITFPFVNVMSYRQKTVPLVTIQIQLNSLHAMPSTNLPRALL